MNVTFKINMSLQFEVFKPLDDNPEFEVSDMGRILHNKPMAIKHDEKGYLIVDACGDGIVKRFGVLKILNTKFTPDELDSPQEIWKIIRVTNKFVYEFSNNRKFRRCNFIKPWISNDGYCYVELNGKTFKVSRLVAQAHLPRLDASKDVVNHKDFILTNNDVSNLEWVSRDYNLSYKNKQNTTSAYFGVCKKKNRDTWEASVQWRDNNNQIKRWRKNFITDDEAARARDAMIRELGLDRILNFN